MKRIRFQYFSDLHLERRTTLPKIVQKADHLILAGDIGYLHTELYKEFLTRMNEQYEHVFVVHGNHEWDPKVQPCSKPFKHLSRVFFLEQQTFQMRHVVLAGTTLWTPTVCPTRFKSGLKFLKQTMETHDPVQHLICITHHLPSYQMVVPKYRLYPNLHRFANHLDYFFHDPKKSPKAWVCGHSHCVFDKKIGYTRCMINTFGPTVHTTFEI